MIERRKEKRKKVRVLATVNNSENVTQLATVNSISEHGVGFDMNTNLLIKDSPIKAGDTVELTYEGKKQLVNIVRENPSEKSCSYGGIIKGNE